jgi:hypothetical protein
MDKSFQQSDQVFGVHDDFFPFLTAYRGVCRESPTVAVLLGLAVGLTGVCDQTYKRLGYLNLSKYPIHQEQ